MNRPDTVNFVLDEQVWPMVTALHVAVGSRLPMRSIDEATIAAGHGICGDRYENSRHRHLTVQSLTGLAQAEHDLGRAFDPALTRRNITLSHGVVPSTPGTRFTLGEVEVEVVRVAAPCKLLDDTIGDGARAALRRRAGSVCRVVVGGTVRLGDEARWHRDAT